MKIENTPIIVANTEWPLPDNLIQDVKSERMINALLNMACPNMDYKDLVGYAEVVAYLYPAVCKSTIHSRTSDIYLYCSYKLAERKGIKDLEFLEGHKELDDYQMSRLNEFKKWIFEKRGGEEKNPVINALKEVFFDGKKIKQDILL